MRFFNTAGPVNYKDHYCLVPLSRFDLTEILLLIDQKKYFVLHAPRQTGKTTCLLALMDRSSERYRQVSLSLLQCRACPGCQGGRKARYESYTE